MQISDEDSPISSARSDIAATPHIKYRTSVIVWIFVGLLILLILALVLATLGRSPAGA